MPTNDIPTPTRRTVMELLKRCGPLTVAALGAKLRVSAVAVRRHLDALERAGLVARTRQPGGRGRPAHVYQLTDRGHDSFPRHYDQLALHLLGAAQAAFGPEVLEELFTRRRRLLAERYRPLVAAATAAAPPAARLDALARALASIQDDNGYMAEHVAEPGGAVVREHNCAIRRVAADHPVACRAELALLQELAGPDITVERIAHLQAGDPHCAYRLTGRGER